MRSNRWWHLVASATDDEQGITLVEVLIATFILSIALLAMASVGLTSLVSLRETRDREQAIDAASAAVEAARARDFRELALAPTAAPGGLPPDVRALLGIDASGTCADGQAIVFDAGSTDPVPLTRTVGTNDAHTIHTLVTWAHDSADCTSTGGTIKRVTTLTTWVERGELLSVRNETLVAPAGRGLPVPNFELRPPEALLRFTPAQVASGTTRCIPHLLRNIGAADTYEWRLAGVEGLSGPPLKTSATSWQTPNGKFEITAFLENPAPEDPRGAAEPPATFRMRDDDGNGLPESTTVVANADRATFTVCYKAIGDDALAFTATIDVVSRFDDRRIETVTHDIRVEAPDRLLYLQDRDDTRSHPRDADPRPSQTSYPPFVMTQLAADPETSDDRSQLLGTQLFDWSNEIGATSLPGLRLLRGNTTALGTADWRYQFPAPTRLLAGEPTLTLYVAPVSALRGDEAAFADGGIRMRLSVRLDALNERENNNNVIWPTTGPITTTVDYLHAGTAWAERVIALPVPAGRDFVAGDRLRVRVTCLTESGEDCNLGYDATSHPARLRVGLQ